MFRAMTITALAITVLGIIVHALIRPGTGPRQGARAAMPCPFARFVRAAATAVVMVCVLGLAVTGFYPRLVDDAAVSGYLLMVHVTLGGVFLAALAAWGVAWAWDHWDPPGQWGRKVAFWLMLVTGLSAGAAIVLNMIPLFGTAWQGLLLEVHRTSALACLIGAIGWGYWMVRR